MSISGKAAMGLLRAFSKAPLVKIRNAQEELDAAKEYNSRHPFRKLSDHCACYHYCCIAGYPCIRIRTRKKKLRPDKAILYLHGGLQNTWKEEIIVARGYADHTGMDVWYPVFPSISEAAATKIIQVIYDVYRRLERHYGADHIAVIGTSFGGTFGFELINKINMEKNAVPMPALYIANSPGGVPDTEEDWEEMRKFSKYDPLIDISAVKNVIGMQKLITDDVPLWAYCPVYEDFSHAPETYVYYAEETLAGNHLAYERGYEKAGVRERLHMHIQTEMMHGYSCMPVFPESKKAYQEQIDLLMKM